MGRTLKGFALMNPPTHTLRQTRRGVRARDPEQPVVANQNNCDIVRDKND